jgi:hypothetical protein
MFSPAAWRVKLPVGESSESEKTVSEPQHSRVPGTSGIARSPLLLLNTMLRIWIRIHQIHMFLDLPDPDPDPLVRGMDPDPSFIMQKNSKKNLDSSYFVNLFDFLSLKNDVNVTSKSNKQKFFFSKISFLLTS